MISQQHVTLIVMTTKLVENEKVKVHKYWPEETISNKSDSMIVGQLKKDGITLRKIEEVELADELTLRVF